MRSASFGQFLPYWTTLQVSVRPSADLPTRHVAVLVLKDGTLTLGLRVRGLDIYGASCAEINAYTATLCEALGTLPPDGYLQAVFESGLGFESVLERFASQNTSTPYPLLRSGRAARLAGLRRHPALRRCQITYWVGWKKALGSLVPKKTWRSSRAPNKGGDLGGSQGALKVRLATEQLADTAQRLMDILASCGLSIRFLSESEILADCHRAINPTAPASLRPPLFIETEEDIRDYAAGEPLLLRGASLSSQLALSSLRCGDAQFMLGDPPRLYRALGVSRYSSDTSPTALFGVLFPESGPCPDRIVVTHQATDRLKQKEQFKRRQRFIGNFLGHGFADQDVKQALVEHECVLEEMATRDARVFHTSLVALVGGSDPQALDKATRSIGTAFSRSQIAMSPFFERQLPAWLGSLPAYGYATPHPTALMDRSCAHLTPFWLPAPGSEHPDILLENRQNGLEALTVRLGAERADAGGIVVGKTGSGKTFLVAHLLKYGVLDLGGHVIVVDNKGPSNSSYRPLCELLGGAYISLQGDPDVAFNPFPPHQELFDEGFNLKQGAGQPYESSLEALERILCMLVWLDEGTQDESSFRRSVAREAILLAYRIQGATGEPVILSTVCTALRSYQPTLKALAPYGKQMLERLEVWLQSPKHARLFNRPQALDTSNPFTVFDFAGMDDDPALAAVLISVLSTRIEAKMATLPKSTPKLFAFDEAWAMFAHSPQACNLLSRLYRVSRSFGAFCYVLTQSYADIAHSAAASGILSNTSLIYLMKHVDKHRETCELFRLTSRQEDLFRSLKKVDGKFAEFLLVDRGTDRTHVLRYAPTPWDLWCDTSKPADVAFREQWQQTTGGTLTEAMAYLAKNHPHGAPEGFLSNPDTQECAA
jgi:hypothetical protein